ncbi:hypothetical protein EMEDMD4_90066 [Sinorhizobium medicae]|uniref:Uncharacterized protein n=1 Tax=Sinorhizobium medicae TaxID=110321 RepID=A0A508XB82_9HYPH|nr:hypothetical protein EMEDMD4_90066 [Sinorhizobium medicae]
MQWAGSPAVVHHIEEIAAVVELQFDDPAVRIKSDF